MFCFYSINIYLGINFFKQTLIYFVDKENNLFIAFHWVKLSDGKLVDEC